MLPEIVTLFAGESFCSARRVREAHVQHAHAVAVRRARDHRVVLEEQVVGLPEVEQLVAAGAARPCRRRRSRRPASGLATRFCFTTPPSIVGVAVEVDRDPRDAVEQVVLDRDARGEAAEALARADERGVGAAGEAGVREAEAVDDDAGGADAERLVEPGRGDRRLGDARRVRVHVVERVVRVDRDVGALEVQRLVDLHRGRERVRAGLDVDRSDADGVVDALLDPARRPASGRRRR